MVLSDGEAYDHPQSLPTRRSSDLGGDPGRRMITPGRTDGPRGSLRRNAGSSSMMGPRRKESEMARRRKKRRSSRGGGRNRTMPPRDPVTGQFMSKAQVAALTREDEGTPSDPAPVPE